MTALEVCQHLAHAHDGLLSWSLVLVDDYLRIDLIFNDTTDDEVYIGHIDSPGICQKIPADLMDSFEELLEERDEAARDADECRGDCGWAYDTSRGRF